MRKLKEVLRLRHELKLGYQQIGRSYAIRGQLGAQVLEARRGGQHHVASAGGLG